MKSEKNIFWLAEKKIKMCKSFGKVAKFYIIYECVQVFYIRFTGNSCRGVSGKGIIKGMKMFYPETWPGKGGKANENN